MSDREYFDEPVFGVVYQVSEAGICFNYNEKGEPRGISNPLKNIIPIPLTEEWLLKFGFECRESSVYKGYYIGENPVTKDWLFDLVFMKDNGQIFYKNAHFTLSYVHQLQNIYFSLTGKELVASI